jgi:hypothetical protein
VNASGQCLPMEGERPTAREGVRSGSKKPPAVRTEERGSPAALVKEQEAAERAYRPDDPGWVHGPRKAPSRR